MKHCSKCDQLRPLTDFSKHKKTKDGLQCYCIACFKLTSKQWYVLNKEHSKSKSVTWNKANKDKRSKISNNWYQKNISKVKGIALKREYNLSMEQYDQLLSQQNNCCMVCHKNQVLFKKKLAVDHCHETGKIRGLLCDGCNRGLGFLKDSIEVLESAITYLKNSREQVNGR